MNIAESLCYPIVCGAAMFLVSWLIFDFWQDILNVPHKRFPRWLVKLIIALLNGGMSYMAEIFTQNNASPRTIALYMPIMIVLEIHILGHMKTKWGAFSIFVLTSFQFITLYSVSLGISNLVLDPIFLASRRGLVLPVTLLNLFLSLFLGSLKLYKISLKGDDRNAELGEILSNYKSSLALILYACTNALAITFLTYDAIEVLNHTAGMELIKYDVCRNMIIRDSILFFSTTLMLDIQARNIKSEKKAKEAIAKNILLERDIQTQNMIQMGLEAARKDLEEKNQKLSTGIEYERRLRDSLHRNILLKFSCNVTKGILIETGAIRITTVNNSKQPLFEDMLKLFLELLVHPDDRDELVEKMSLDNLSSLPYGEKGFKVSMRVSPRGFINYISLDDESAKIHAYMDRDYIWTDLDCTVVIGDDGDTYAYFYVMDIDEQKQKDEIIRKAASTDALTGLFNRRSFVYHLDKYLADEENLGGALFMFDLDYFKSVNDNLGHPKGDVLLKDVANILTNTFRTEDILCRIGGDEFCAFAKGFTDIDLIKKRAEYLNEAGRKSFDIPNGKSINVSFSIGIAVIPGDANNSDDLYTKADSALYKAKEAGRNCYRMYK